MNSHNIVFQHIVMSDHKNDVNAHNINLTQLEEMMKISRRERGVTSWNVPLSVHQAEAMSLAYCDCVEFSDHHSR